METNPKLNQFSRLKRKVKCLHEDICYLRACKKKKLLPSFIKIKVAVSNPRAQAAIKCAQMKWLNLEIKHKFKLLSDTELKVYNLHLDLTKT